MAKFYNKKTNQILWGDDDIICPLEDAWSELREYIATKKLDGHDMYDQWLMKVEMKMDELLTVLVEEAPSCVPDFTDKNIEELY